MRRIVIDLDQLAASARDALLVTALIVGPYLLINCLPGAQP